MYVCMYIYARVHVYMRVCSWVLSGMATLGSKTQKQNDEKYVCGTLLVQPCFKLLVWRFVKIQLFTSRK